MRNWVTFTTLFIALLPVPGRSHAQDVIDRIVARVETDIILLSDVRHLNRYQVFWMGKRKPTRTS